MTHNPEDFYPPYHPHHAALPPVSGMAVASMVLGIVGVVMLVFQPFGAVLGLLAVIFGSVSFRDTAVGARSGKGFAIAGVVLGWIVLGVTLFDVMTWLALG